MQGDKTEFISYLSMANAHFIIPVYQRHYAWKIENCKQLYDDILILIKNTNLQHHHFFGSLVSHIDHRGVKVYSYLIDGQQRLTTVSLLLLALYKLNEEGEITFLDNSLIRRLYDTCLFDPYNNKPKLSPIETDRAAFVSLFENSSDLFKTSNFVINYNYFKEQLKKDITQNKFTADEFFNHGICRLDVISITLESHDEPQLIFESLNSTGVDLNEGDKIRNFVLMGLPINEQETLHKNYWKNIEHYAGNEDHDVSIFVRDYLCIQLHKPPAMSKIYTEFKNYIRGQNKDIGTILKDLLDYARRYDILLNGNKVKNTKDITRLNTCIYRLNRLDSTVCRPFLMEVLRLNEEGSLTDAETFKVFSLIETYIFRRYMCDVPSNSLNKIFPALHREVIGYDGTSSNYVEKLKYALISKRENNRFPGNDDFSKHFAEREVYTAMSPKNRIYILERLENRDEFMGKNVYEMFEKKAYSIEHIMPQTLTATWKTELGPEYARIHKNWLHRIANLTITAFNSQSSNLSFTEKKIAQGGFSNNSLYLSQWIKKQDKWTETELEKRNALLVKEALKIWPMPKTSFKPIRRVTLYTINHEDQNLLNNRKISKYIYKGTEQAVSTWKAMFENVLNSLHSEHPALLPVLAETTDNSNVLSRFVFTEPGKNFAEVGDSLYVFQPTQTDVMLYLLSRFFEAYGEDPDDLVIVLNDTKTPKEIAEAKLKIEKHASTKFFKYARHIIENIQGANCLFTTYRVKRWTLFWDNFCLPPYSLSCIVISNGAAVVLEFNSSDEENEMLFNQLYGHKEEIERKLGAAIFSEESRRSVSVQLDKGLSDEENWQEIAQFLATWSMEFYKVLIPYLE